MIRQVVRYNLRTMKRLFVFFALAILAVSASAQIPGGNTSRMMLAIAPDSSKELKITKDQNRKIQDALKEMQKGMQGGGVPSGFDMMNPMAGMDAKIDEILTDIQKVRMEELFVQKNGGMSLTDAKVAAALVLTEEQTVQIKALSDDARTAVMEMAMKVRSNSDMKKMKEKQKEFGDKMLQLCTTEQLAKFETMKGKPFKFKE